MSTQLLTGSPGSRTLYELWRWLCSRCAPTEMFKGTPVISAPLLVLPRSTLALLLCRQTGVCWNASVCNLKLSLDRRRLRARVSQCAATQPFKNHYFPEASGPLNAAVPRPRRKHRRHNRRNDHNNASAPPRRLLRHSSAGKRSSQTVRMQERQGAREREKHTQKTPPLITINLQQPSSLSAVRNRWANTGPPRSSLALHLRAFNPSMHVDDLRVAHGKHQHEPRAGER